MRVLSIHHGADTAGVGYGLSRAFAGHPTITLRSTVRKGNYLRYPTDLPWGQATTEWARADVVHLHNSFRSWRLMGHDRPFVIHHHGTQYRDHADVLNAAVTEHGGRAVVATLDLLDHGEGLTWVPQPHDLDALARHRKRQHGGRLRIGHAPTDRAIKSTDTFLAACARLDVEPVLIERRPWAECLRIKGTCDVLFDQVQLGYGSNAIEAWAMGLPVIAGAAPSTLQRMTDTFGDLPFLPATEDTIADAIDALRDPDVRDEWGARGLGHVRRWHDGGETVTRLERVYRGVVG